MLNGFKTKIIIPKRFINVVYLSYHLHFFRYIYASYFCSK